MQLIVSLACAGLAAYLGWRCAAWCYRVWRAVSIVRARNNPVDVWPDGVEEDTFSDKLR